MSITSRTYDPARDGEAISAFLTRHFQPHNRDGNWLQPVWEYAYIHPATKEADLAQIGLWEDGGEVVGAAIFDIHPIDTGICIHPDYRPLRTEMRNYAEKHFPRKDAGGRKTLRIYVPADDEAWNREMADADYRHITNPPMDRDMSEMPIPEDFPMSKLPDGYTFTSVKEVKDYALIVESLWKGFNHEGPYQPDDPAREERIFHAPNFRPDLTTIIRAPDGELASYCGIWHNRPNAYAYVEPVATVPAHRRKGLGAAVVREAIRRAGIDGAKTVFIWSNMKLYQSVGFKRIATHNCWTRFF